MLHDLVHRSRHLAATVCRRRRAKSCTATNMSEERLAIRCFEGPNKLLGELPQLQQPSPPSRRNQGIYAMPSPTLPSPPSFRPRSRNLLPSIRPLRPRF